MAVLMYQDKFIPKFRRFNTFNCAVLLCSYFHSLITLLLVVVFAFSEIHSRRFVRILPYTYFPDPIVYVHSGFYRMCAYVLILHYMRIS
jgi:hypothetical protein